MIEPIQLAPPLEITTFLDRLHQAGQRVVPGSLRWLEHPTRAGWLIPAVMVEAIEAMERKEQ